MARYGFTLDEMSNATSEYFKRQRERLYRDRESKNTHSNTLPLSNKEQAFRDPAQTSNYINYNYYNYPANKVNNFSVAKVGIFTFVIGCIGHYLYSRSITFADKVNALFGNITELYAIKPEMLFAGIVMLGLVLMMYGTLRRL